MDRDSSSNLNTRSVPLINSNPDAVTVSLVESSSRFGSYALVNPKDTYKCHDPMDLVELARQVQKADEFTRANAHNKLQVIVEQIRFLQQQAKKVLEESKRDNNLHHVACNFKKIPGKIYHLYVRPSGQRYFSMLSPQEWATHHEYLGSYRVEHDMSWTPAEKVEERTSEINLLDRILTAQQALTDSATLTEVASTPPQTASEVLRDVTGNVKKVDGAGYIDVEDPQPRIDEA